MTENEMNHMLDDARFYKGEGHNLDTIMHYIAEDWNLSDEDFVRVREEVIFFVTGKKKAQ